MKKSADSGWVWIAVVSLVCAGAPCWGTGAGAARTGGLVDEGSGGAGPDPKWEMGNGKSAGGGTREVADGKWDMGKGKGAMGDGEGEIGKGNGGAVGELTIEQAVRLALENNPELRASTARVDAAAGRAWDARQWTNPALQLNAEEWPVSSGHGFSDAKQTIGLAQTLPFPGKKSLDKRIGGAGVNLSKADLAVRQTEIVRDVKAAFFQVLAAERLADVSGELLRVAESSAVTARKRVDAGAAAYQEQLRAEVQLEQARTELADYQRELAAARQVFVTVLGKPELKDARLAGALAETPNPALLEARFDGVLERHPKALAAQARVKQAQLEASRSRLEPYPDVTMAAAGGRLGETDESIIEMGFSVPLPIFNRGKGKQQEARANVRVAEAELRGAQQELQRAWTTAQNRYRTAVEQVGNYRDRILPKAREALQLVQTGFEEGKFGFIDLVDTQRTTAEAQLAYQKKLLELSVAQAELEALLQPQSVLTNSTNKND